MNEKNDKWLDDIISKAVNNRKPKFDAEKFKQKFPEEMHILKSRASKKQRTSWWRTILSDPFSSIATAAVLVLMVGIFVYFSGSKDNTTPLKEPKVTQTPAQMMSLISINLAYNRGGLDEVEKQYEKAITEIGPRPKQITIAELLAESNGT